MKTTSRAECAVLVLCAGHGSRLGTLTADMPKPLLDVCGQPIVGHTLDLLAKHGFTGVTINTHHHADMIHEALGQGARYGVELSYLHENELSGTAGPLIKLRDDFKAFREVLVVYGDLVLDEDLSSMLQFHHDANADVTLLVHRRALSNSALVLDDDKRVVRFLERPSAQEFANAGSNWVNSGVQLLSQAALQRLPERLPADLPLDLYIPHLQELKIMAYPLTGYRVAVDSPERLALARKTWATR